MPFLDIFAKKDIEIEKKVKVIVDKREKNSLVASELMKLGANVVFEMLAVGDYLVGDVVIERKTVSDLKGSIINKRIFQQLEEIRQASNFLLLVEENTDDIYKGIIHENALRGFFLRTSLNFRVPILFTKDSQDSARYLYVLAKRSEKGIASIRQSKIVMTKEEQMQFILEGFPHVGPTLAKKLMEKFGTLEKVFGANEEELGEVLGKRAGEFRILLTGS